MPCTITFCTPQLDNVRLPGDRPLRILFLTSIRDTGECDRNGLVVETGSGPGYMEGVVERTVQLRDHYRVVGVVVDDLPHNLRDYPVSPEADRPWLWPLSLDIPVWHIPSDFRLLAKSAIAEREQRKLAFEQAVYDLFTELGEDVIVSDHYMARIEHLIGVHGLAGRVLNIHPAVTVHGHEFCFRGPTPTADAIARAQHDANTVTGATLHLVNDVIDDGPAVAYGVGTPVYATDQPQWLRWRNYQMAKLPVFIAGMLHYRELVTR